MLIGAMNLNSPMNVFDLGANNGGFPILLKLCKFQLKKVVCVEMNPATFTRLKCNVERNCSCEFFPLNAAVYSETCELLLALGKGSTGESIYSDRPIGSNQNTQKIRAMTLNEIYEATFDNQLVDICKMDVERAEYDVFLNEGHEHISKCRYLIIEIHDSKDHRPEEVINRLTQLGFEEIQIPKEHEPVFGFRNLALI